MRNQKVAMNEKRAGRLRWYIEDGKFVAQTFIDKKFLETFRVDFELNPTSGETAVEVNSLHHEALKLEKAQYGDLNGAINAVNEFFGKMDEMVDNMPLEVRERAFNAYKREIARGFKIN